MIAAELLKLRRKRALVVPAFLLTTGIVVALLAWVGVDQPPGGQHNFENAMTFLGAYFGLLAALLVGAEAGAGDLASGVFRDLVLTGRSRLALFAVRVPGGLLLLLPLLGLAFVVAVAVSFGLAGDEPTPSVALVARYALWVALVGAVALTISVGVASLLGSRPTAITMLVAWFLIADPLLSGAAQLGAARQALLSVAIFHLKPGRDGDITVATSTTTAIVVLLAWCAAAWAAGAWRTATQDA